MGSPVGLRERKKRRTREALVEAALELFADQGFDETTIEEIALRADVSPRTFFRYFASKEDVVFADHEEATRMLELVVAEDAPPAEILRRAVLALAERFAAEGDRRAARIRLALTIPAVMARSLEVQARFEDVVAEAVAHRLGGRGARSRARVASGAAFGVLRASMRAWVESDARGSPAATARDALAALSPGLEEYLSPPRRRA